MQKRYSHGLTFSANYTFSKNIQATSYVNAQDAAPTRVLTAFDRPQRLAFTPSYELPFGPGRRFLNSSNGVVKRLVGGWQVLANTVYQSGAPMGVPSNVWVIGDPHLENPTWDRLFKTGYIDSTGIVRNVLAGRAAGICSADAELAADHAGALGKSARPVGHHLRCIGDQEYAHSGRHELPVPIRSVQRVEHARFFLRSEPDTDVDELRQDHSGQRAE